MELNEILNGLPHNQTIRDDIVKCYSKINHGLYDKIICSISGGSDSDIVLDMVSKCDKDNKVDYVWFDTGLEYEATKEHINFLENKYRIKIMKCRALKPIPVVCREYGQPFISKYVSEQIERLQKHNFLWEDESYEWLAIKYPKCRSALKWWCGDFGRIFSINNNKYLKQFLVENPPYFSISSKCCNYAKKKVVKSIIRSGKYELNIVGLRKSEGGIRSVAYKSCFLENWDDAGMFMPIFWFNDGDKVEYEQHYGVVHSRCYTEYGFKRTECACCPFGAHTGLEWELETVKEYEPKLYKAVCNIFHDSYEYTRKYNEFKEKMKGKKQC